MADAVRSVVIDLSLPVVTVVFTGSRIERRRQTFLSAFLAAVVELGGRTTVEEAGAHLLPGVPLAITASIVKNLENYGLVGRSLGAVSLTAAGIEALASGRVPVEEKGTWAVDVAVAGDALCMIRCEKVEVSDYQLRQARKKRVAEGVPPGPRDGPAVPADLFGSWHRLIGSGGAEVRLDRTADRLASAPSEASLSLRIARRGGDHGSAVVSTRVGGGGEREFEPTGSLADWLGEVEAWVDEVIAGVPVNLDFLSDDEVVVGARTVSLLDLHLGNGAMCRRVEAEGVHILPPADEIDRWFDRLVAARLAPGMGATAVLALACEVASGLGLSGSSVPPESSSILSRVRSDIERRGGRFSPQWWCASTPTDWEMA